MNWLQRLIDKLRGKRPTPPVEPSKPPEPTPDPIPPPEPVPEPPTPAVSTLREAWAKRRGPDCGDSSQFLWKPVSESDGKLVVLLPAWMEADAVAVGHENGNYRGRNVENGTRQHWRFSRPGSGFGTVVPVAVSRRGREIYRTTIANGASRVQADVPGPAWPLVRGLMLTDAACDLDLPSRAAELRYARRAYNTVLTMPDLQCLSGAKPVRPYVSAGRDRDRLSDLSARNLRWLLAQGYELHVIVRNSWGVKNGYAPQMPSIGRSLAESELYSAARLEEDWAFCVDLIAKVPEVSGLMLTLESQAAASRPYCAELAARLRRNGFEGIITDNWVGDNKGVELQRNGGMLPANSINDPSKWHSSTMALRNSDGMRALDRSRHDLIRNCTSWHGPTGFYIWAAELVGGPAGRGSIPREYTDHAGGVA